MGSLDAQTFDTGTDQQNIYVNTAYEDVDLDNDKAGDVEVHAKTNGTSNEVVDDVEDENYDNPPCGWFGIRPRFIQVIILRG